MRKQPHNFDPQQSPRVTYAPDGLPVAEQQEGEGPLQQDPVKETGLGVPLKREGSETVGDRMPSDPMVDTGRSEGSSQQQCAPSNKASAVTVQPSFDDPLQRDETPASSPEKREGHQSSSAEPHPQDWQDRSPTGDGKEVDHEPRSPASPKSDQPERGQFYGPAASNDSQSEDENRKHRRIFSGGFSNPPSAHRRIDSRGASTTIRRDSNMQKNHKRADSGLDILSAAVTKGVLAEAAAGTPASRPGVSWDLPESQGQQTRVSVGQASSGSYDHPPPPQNAYGVAPQPTHAHMNPPHRRPASNGGFPQVHPHFNTHPMPFPSTGPYTGFPNSYYPPPPYGPRTVPQPHHGYPPYHQRPPEYGKAMMYRQYPPPPPPREQRIDSDERLFENKAASTSAQPAQPWNVGSSAQGAQTLVTSIPVVGSKTMVPSAMQKNAPPATEDSQASLPLQPGHHRKLSSFSSLGTMIGQNLFSPGDGRAAGRPGHHRHTSSSISLLGLEVGLESSEDVFLRNLQSANQMVDTSPTPRESGNDSPTSREGGGTSKRVRRKCMIDNCANRVVQGGLCISHGAKRKTCKHPGCNKNVKKAGLCSTHGPARKRCDADGCVKVAVQGGRCIAHGARKKMCLIDNCNKQAILSGMCKKHHDLTSEDEKQAAAAYCRETSSTPPPPAAAVPPAPPAQMTEAQKSHHRRGLSIFQEMSANEVSHILNDDGAPAERAAPSASEASHW